ncbi:MAG: PEP-CTERM sorting domain-containing protein [Planctomycetota bacterium]|jgi:hypothetical protein
MKRILGLVLGLLVCGQSASAALLVSYQFASNGDATYESVNNTEFTATTFANAGTAGAAGINGAVSSGYWQTAATVTNTTPNTARFNRITLTNNNYRSVVIDSLSADLWKASGTGTGNVRVQFSTNAGATWSDFGSNATQSTISSSLTSQAATDPVLTAGTPIVLSRGSSIDLRFQWFRSGSPAALNTLRFDDLKIFGDAFPVPEPLSVATFGLVGAGLAVARRRKQR